MPVQIQLRHGTAAEWTAADPTLAEGEAGVETDTGKFKMGDGSTAWTSLPYSSGIQGDPGDPGAPGEGVPVGGATGEALVKASAADYDTTWAARLADTGVITYLDGTVAGAPGTPASGKLRIYAKTGKVLAVKDDAGVETELGAGGGGTITVEDEGTPLSTGADTLDFVGDGVTASGTGTTKTITIPGTGVTEIVDLPTAEMDDSLVLAPDGAGGVEFRAEAGGGSTKPYLDQATLDGTYGDDFEVGDLDAKWTARGITAESCIGAQGDGSHLWMDYSVLSDASIWQAFTNKDEADIIASYSQMSYNTDVIVGPYIVSSTGTGVHAGLRASNATHLLCKLVAYVYDSIGTNLSLGRAGDLDLGQRLWVLLAKRSGIYFSRYSFDGINWGQPIVYTPSAFTPAKIGFGRVFSTNIPVSVRLGRFNVLNAFNIGDNLVRTPTSGTPTYSASAVYGGGYEADKAADGNTADGWAAPNANYPLWWQVAWSVGQTLNRVRIISRSQNFGTFYVELSDGVDTWRYPGWYLEAQRWCFVDFPTRTGITTLKVVGIAGAGGATGLAEVEAYLAS